MIACENRVKHRDKRNAVGNVPSLSPNSSRSHRLRILRTQPNLPLQRPLRQTPDIRRCNNRHDRAPRLIGSSLRKNRVPTPFESHEHAHDPSQ